MTNPTEDMMEQRLVNRIGALERQMADLKTTQLTGGGSVVIGRLSGSITQTLLPNSRGSSRISFKTANRQLFQSEFGFSFFFDVDNDPDHQWPDGVALTSDQKNMRREFNYDPASSSETTLGYKSYILSIWNPSTTATLSVITHITLDYPLIGLTA